MICFAAIAPHGDVDGAPELRAAMEELGRRFDAAAPEVAIVVTPHNVHVEGHFAVVVSARVGPHEVDRELAAAVVAALRTEGLPVVGVSYGGNDPGEAEMPLDWGTEVPLAFLHVPRVVVVSPARDRPLAEHVRAGAALARAVAASNRLLRPAEAAVSAALGESNTLLRAGTRVALVASADHGHAHDPDGPYGYDPAATGYDALAQEVLASGRLDFAPLADLVEDAKADSLWQLLVLQGAVGEVAAADVLAYAAPTYYGMLVASVSVSV